MSAELLIANFLRIAAEDLDGARQLATTGNRNSVYLCEQAAEKVIRAAVTAEGKHAGIKHDLAEMVDMLAEDHPLKPALRAIEHLSQYATSYRYPVASSWAKRIQPGPAEQELQAAIGATARALTFAVAHFEVDLARDTPAVIRRPKG